jgi:hypothetical protein
LSDRKAQEWMGFFVLLIEEREVFVPFLVRIFGACLATGFVPIA